MEVESVNNEVPPIQEQETELEQNNRNPSPAEKQGQETELPDTEQIPEENYSEQELDDWFKENNSNDFSDELSDMLLVLDREERDVKAVKGIGKDGELETVPPTAEHNNEFFKLDSHGDLLSNFFTNFFNQAKDPTRFRFFKVPVNLAGKIANLFKSHKDDPDHAVTKLMKKHEIDIPQLKKILEQMEQEKEKQGKQEETSRQSTQQSTQQTAGGDQQKSVGEKQPTGVGENQSNGESQAQGGKETTYRYNVDQIDWKSVEAYGLTKEKLERNNVLDTLLQGFKSPGLHYVSVNNGGVVCNMDARLSLREKNDGKVYLAISGIKREPSFQFPFMGHKFSDEDQTNLKQTRNMGRIVNLVHPSTGEVIPSVISIDHLTNEYVACPASKIKIPEVIGGVKIDQETYSKLLRGEATYIPGMVSTKGEPLNVPVQFNAEKRYVEYLLGDRGKLALDAYKKEQGIPNDFRGVQLTPEQHQNLEDGKTVYLSNIISAKTGNSYDGYLAWDSEKNKPNFVIANQYQEAVEKGKILPYDGEPVKQTTQQQTKDGVSLEIPTSYRGKELTPGQMDTLKDGGTVFMGEMTSKSNKTYQLYVTTNPETGKIVPMFPDEYHKKVDEGSIRPAVKEPNNGEGQGQQNQKSNKNTEGESVDAHKSEVPANYRHHELSNKDQKYLENGGTVKVTGKQDAQGNPYVGYITWTKELGFKYLYPNQYAEGVTSGAVQPVAKHEAQVAVNSEGKTNEATKSVKEPLKSGQSSPTEAQDKNIKEKKDEQSNKNSKKNSGETKKNTRKAPKHKM